MEFRTIIDIPEFQFRIGYEQQGLLIGSCFATSMGERLERMKMPVTVNPFGVVYNPLSVIRTLETIRKGTALTAGELMEDNGLWFTFSHHGSFASPDKTVALSGINNSIQTGHKALLDSDYLILTLGTAWVYEWVQTGEVVNNCHKFPAREFRRRRLRTEEIVAAFERLIEKPTYQNKKIILTVSPIRHIKDGLAENQLSKATLLVAVHQLTGKYENVFYFPSYEILMDDLRDYRFYERDMVHPSTVAIDYIWDKFCSAVVDNEAGALFKRIEKLNAALAHRPFNPDTPQHQTFKNTMLAEITELKGQYPLLDFSEEFTYFSE